MPQYSYTATNNQNQAVSGTINQPDRNSAIRYLTSQNLRPISIEEVKEKQRTSLKITNTLGSNRVKPDQLVVFTRQLSTMVGAGVPLIRALSALSEHASESPTLHKILESVISDVEAGSMLGDALAKYPNTFNDIYVNMVRAGEAAGILDEVLNRLAIQQEKSMSMRKRIKSAMTYPIVLLCIAILAFFGLMIFIVPRIGNITKDLVGNNAELPALTKAMLGISDFLINYWWIILLSVAILVYSLLVYFRTKKGRYAFHSFLLKAPLIKKIITKVVVARFARTFSALIQAGVAVLEALDVTSRAVGNAVYEKAIVDAETEIKNGKTLSAIIAKNPLFPNIVAQMLLVGEETGKTDEVLVKVADFYEDEVDTSISGLSSIIEPVMIVILGGTVGLIAASVMLPIAGIAQQIQ